MATDRDNPYILKLLIVAEADAASCHVIVVIDLLVFVNSDSFEDFLEISSLREAHV